MNRGEIRARVLEQADWNPVYSSAFSDLVNRFINRALNSIYEELPFLCVKEAKIITIPDTVCSASDTLDRLTIETTDHRIFYRVDAGLSSSAPGWKIDGTWDGRYVELTGSDGVIHQFKTREWWAGTNTHGQACHFFSTEEPWESNTDVNLSYRVYTPSYALPPECGDIKNVQLWADPNIPIEFVLPQDAEQYRLVDFLGRAVGFPRIGWQSDPVQLISPSSAPAVALDGVANWAGPDNAGQFDFLYTYILGNQDSFARTPQGWQEPKWESGPSPISSVITATNSGHAIKILLPDIDQELGFTAGSVGEGRSGMRIRIYARRYTFATDGGITRRIEVPQTFMLLAEVAGNAGSYTYDGSKYLDMLRKFNPIQSYRTLSFFPMPDQRYELHARIQFRPPALANDTATPYIDESALDALVYKTLEMLAVYDKQNDLVPYYLTKYTDECKKLTKRFSKVQAQYFNKQPARAVQRPIAQRSKYAKFDPSL